MKDDLPYFSHDNDSRNHAKMKALRARYGWTGYGQFWALNEMIAGAAEARLDLGRKVVRAATACELGMTPEAMDDFLSFLSNVDECGLIHYTDGIITTDRTQEDYDRVAMERSRKRDFGKNSAEKRKNSAEKHENSAEAPRNNSTEERRGEETIQEDSIPEEIDNPSTSKPRVVFSPTDELVSTRFERHRKAWNYAELPGGRFTFLNLNGDEVSAVKAVYNAYSDTEIEKAIENYKTVITGAEYDYDEKYQYKTFVAFLKKGVQQFVDDAKPMEAHRKRETQAVTVDDDDFERFNAKMRKE